MLPMHTAIRSRKPGCEKSGWLRFDINGREVAGPLYSCAGSGSIVSAFTGT